MKTIIISDIHNRTEFIEPLLSSISHDKVIFLGDYWDDYYDTYDDIVRTSKWLKKSLYISNRIHLHGNHDLWYRFYHNHHIMCSGNTEEKAKIISNIMEPNDWKMFKLYYFEQNFHITHAGIHPKILNSLTIHDIDIVTSVALTDVKCDNPNQWIEPGIARGGFNQIGGITWLDWNCEFEPIPNINQIVGHTPMLQHKEKITYNSMNYCLDTNNHHIGILEDGKLEIIKNKYL